LVSFTGMETAAGHQHPQGRNAEEELHACPLGQPLQMTGQERNPRDGRNGRKPDALTRPDESANAERAADLWRFAGKTARLD
jgi:hypothetical protein